jgi:hypothetical protein
MAARGSTWALRYPAPVDDLPRGTRWTSADLSGSPLAFMGRPPVVLKADDFGGPLGASEARFVDLLEARGAVAGLGVVTSHLPSRPEVIASYRALQARGHELWFHGHTHDWWLPRAEFAGVGVERMDRSLAAGLNRSREVLGVELRTFGAPGNAIDAQTGVALGRHPQLRVWLFGREGYGIASLPRRLELETAVGRCAEATGFLARLDALPAEPELPLVLELHPGRYAEPDFANLEAVLEGLAARGLRTATPYGWWSWLEDAGRVALEKVGNATYHLSLAAARHGHRVELGAGGPLPAIAPITPPAPAAAPS